MSVQTVSMSSVKLGLAVAWPAFWTGVPIKVVVALLLLAAGVHPWDMPGLVFLLVLSVPVDIWALSLSARTVFLDRLRLQPPEGIGLTLWWQAALFSALYLPAAYVIETQAVAGSKAVAARIMEVLTELPVAERIGIELTLWGSVATVVLLALALGWLFVFGSIVRRQATAAGPAQAPYQALVRQWDLLRIPSDQPLLLTVFTVSSVILVLLFWVVMPVTTPHPNEEYGKPAVKAEPPFKPAETLQMTEKLITQAEAALEMLEAKAKDEAKGKGQGKAKAGARESAPPVADRPAASARAVKTETTTGTTDAHATEDHTH